MSDLGDSDRAIVDEEMALLGRVRASLARAGSTQADERKRADAVETVRALRSEAASASEDDLPAILHELAVRQTLLARPQHDGLPDLDSPYLAHLRVREQGTEKDYCLSRHSHLDPSERVRVVDWRVAPVARIFYGYREGDEYEEEFPGRVAEGTLVARRIVTIVGGELQQVVCDDRVLERSASGEWQRLSRSAFAIAGGGAGSAVRAEAGKAGPNVTALLDARQFAAISAPSEQPLLVLGSAGSGKTTVALHRLARVTTLDSARYPAERARVIVPEEGLARLSRRLLEPLGIDQAQVATLDDWALSQMQHAFSVRLPARCPDTPALVASLKRHPALYRALHARFAGARQPTFKRLRRQLAELFSDRDFLNAVIDDSQGTLSRAAVEATVRHTMMQLGESVQQQVKSVTDRSRLRTLDGRSLSEGDLAQTQDIEELPIFLAILAWSGKLGEAPASHLVLDEAEDFALFELSVLRSQQGDQHSITLAGDEAQQTHSSFAGFDAALAELGASHAELCRLAISYRCPKPIFELARAVLGPLAATTPTSAARDGVPVGMFDLPSPELGDLFAVNELMDLALREPEASIAVIAHDAEAARRFHALLPEHARARLVLEGEFGFEPGIDVTDLDSVKGLEFDYVLVPRVTEAIYPATDDSRRRLHVAVTRAVSQLWLISGGPRSTLVPWH